MKYLKNLALVLVKQDTRCTQDPETLVGHKLQQKPARRVSGKTPFVSGAGAPAAKKPTTSPPPSLKASVDVKATAIKGFWALKLIISCI